MYDTYALMNKNALLQSFETVDSDIKTKQTLLDEKRTKHNENLTKEKNILKNIEDFEKILADRRKRINR